VHGGTVGRGNWLLVTGGRGFAGRVLQDEA